jgi:hypothetical protein
MGDRSRNERVRRLLLALCVALPARGSAAPAAPEVEATRAEDRVIFDAEAARKSMSSEAEGKFWTPTLSDVLAFEEKLPAYLREHHQNRRKEPLWKRASGYKRQYFGMTRKGARVIYGNFFCHVPSTRAADWHTVPVQVEDGGDCYFNVVYDVKRGAFQDLMVNGEA